MDADIIRAAATSFLGILALLILVVSGLALAFFRHAATGVRLVIFGLILTATVVFSIVVVATQPVPENESKSQAPAIDSPQHPRAPSADTANRASGTPGPSHAAAPPQSATAHGRVAPRSRPTPDPRAPGETSIQTQGDCSPVISGSNTADVEVVC